MFTSKLSREQWAEARRMRADGATCAYIGRHFGLAASTIGARAQREGWPSRTGRSATSGRPQNAPASPGTTGIRSHLAQRLYRVIDYRIRLMEMRMQKQLEAHDRDPGGPMPPAQTAKDERDSFAALIESIKQVTEMASEPAAAADGRRRTATGAVNPELTALSDDIDADGLAVASEKDQYRRELAEHLGKMFPKP
jgi:hypothetical protein